MEKLEIALPFRLSLVHGRVGALDQVVRGVTILRVDANANAAGQVMIMPGNGERARHRGENLFRGEGRISCIGDLWEQDHEFIPAEAAYGVGTPYTSNRAFRNQAKQLVARRVPQRIVDLFEAIQIQKQYGKAIALPAGQGKRLRNPIVQ